MKRIAMLIAVFMVVCATFLAPDAFAEPNLIVYDVDFNAVVVGYTLPTANGIGIGNSGTSDAHIVSVTVSNSDFTIGTGDNTITPNGITHSWTVQPIVGLAVGIHTATITVIYDNDATATGDVRIDVRNATPSAAGSNALGGMVGSVGAKTVDATVAGVYGNEQIDLKADIGGNTVTTSRFGNGDVQFNFTTADFVALAAGTYDIMVSSDATTNNDAIPNTKVGQLVIDKVEPAVSGTNALSGTAGSVGAKTVTVTLAGSYTEALPLNARIGTIDVPVTHTTGDGTVSFGFTAAQLNALAAGSYPITVSSEGSTSNEAIDSTNVGTLTVNARPVYTYTLTVTPPTFDAVTLGYERPPAKPITITSIGNSAATITKVESSSPDFVIGGSGNTVASGGCISTWTMQPVSGLPVGSHTATITVTYNGGATATAQVSLQVKEPPEPAEVFDIGIEALTAAKGTTLTLPILTGYKGTWTPGDPSIAKIVNKQKQVKALKVGETTLTYTVTSVLTGKALKLNDRNLKAGESYTIKFIVRKSGQLPTKITLNKKKLTLDTLDNTTVQLIATVKPAKALDREVIWTSSKPDVATVDQDGNVTAVSPGTTKITAATANLKKVTVTVTVLGAVTKVKLNKSKQTIKAGETYQLTATVNADALDKTITWASGNTSVATVDENGVVTALKKGTAKITATASNGKKATCTITVKKASAKAQAPEQNPQGDPTADEDTQHEQKGPIVVDVSLASAEE